MKLAAEVIISGIKCDSRDCGYENDSVDMGSYGDWLNKPCPECGANLLTEADLSAAKGMIAAADWLCAIVPPDLDSPVVRARIELDGTGVPKLGKVTIEEDE